MVGGRDGGGSSSSCLTLNKSRQGNAEVESDSLTSEKKHFVEMFLSVGSNAVEADGASQRDVGGFFYSVGFSLGSLHKSKEEKEKTCCSTSGSLSASACLQALRTQGGILLTGVFQRGFGKSTTPKVNVCPLFFFSFSSSSYKTRLVLHQVSHLNQ